jgi:hypothetical protein
MKSADLRITNENTIVITRAQLVDGSANLKLSPNGIYDHAVELMRTDSA